MLHFYRCQKCLEVMTHKERILRGECGICGGKIEYMGQVVKDKLIKTEERCACDDRCTCATGPTCECKCGGENHGSGKTVEVVIGINNVPVLKPKNTEQALKRATEIDSLKSCAVEKLKAVYGQYYDAFITRQWIDNRATWSNLQYHVETINKIYRMKVHSLRVKKMTAHITKIA